MSKTSSDPSLVFIFEAKILTDPPQLLHHTRHGQRRIINIKGGIVSGPHLQGVILPGGADWQTIRTDGTVDISARYSIKTEDGAIIYLQDRGIRTASQEVLLRAQKGEQVDTSEFFMRTSAILEADQDGPYSWVNKCIILSSGVKTKDHVHIRFFKVT